MTMQSVSSNPNTLAAAPGTALSLKRAIETLRLWRARIKARRELALLSNFDLRDIGYPATVEAEKNKPFWRA